MDKKVTAVVPALNEENTIGDVVKGLRSRVDEVIVVDDGSRDKTPAIAQREGAVVISHEKNAGYDKSIDEGFALAAKRGAGIILTFDADGQHNPDDIPRLIAPILTGKADLVVGRRPYKARITEYLFAFIARMKAGVDDPLCGLKSYDVKVYNDVGYFDRLASIGTELMFRAGKKGYRIAQIDIQ